MCLWKSYHIKSSISNSVQTESSICIYEKQPLRQAFPSFFMILSQATGCELWRMSTCDGYASKLKVAKSIACKFRLFVVNAHVAGTIVLKECCWTAVHFLAKDSPVSAEFLVGLATHLNYCFTIDFEKQVELFQTKQ